MSDYDAENFLDRSPYRYGTVALDMSVVGDIIRKDYIPSVERQLRQSSLLAIPETFEQWLHRDPSGLDGGDIDW